jgi:hypothetical protein
MHVVHWCKSASAKGKVDTMYRNGRLQLWTNAFSHNFGMCPLYTLGQNNVAS